MIEKLIKKYSDRIETLRANKSFVSEGDEYPYEIDINLNKEIIKDLRRLKANTKTKTKGETK